MEAWALVMLSLLAGRHLLIGASKDCPVLVTGPDRPWTQARKFEWIQTATSIGTELPDQPAGRSEVSFSVLTLLSGLELRLTSSLHPGGYLVRVSPDGWLVQRTFVGTAQTTLASGSPPPDQTTAPDQWSSYAVSLTRPAGTVQRLQLQRLYDNGTRAVWLEVDDSRAVAVDALATRATPPQGTPTEFGQGGGVGPVAAGHWAFWKQECTQFYYRTVDLCHLWPAWPSDVPLQLRTPNLRINPVVNVNVLLRVSGAAELFLFETAERHYVITVTPGELTLGRADHGVSHARTVSRACLAPTPAPAGYRLLWVSVLRGIINIGLDGARPCPEEEVPSPAEPPADIPAQEGTTVGPAALEGDGEGAASAPPAPGRTALITWRDVHAYFVLSYGVRTPDGQGVWTVGCQPTAEESLDSAASGLSPRGVFNTMKPNDSPAGPGLRSTGGVSGGGRGGGGGGDCPDRQPFLLATAVLSVVSVTLLLVTVLLGSALLAQRRRRFVELAATTRRLSLASTDLFGCPPVVSAAPAAAPAHTTAPAAGEHQYAELRLYEDIMPMSMGPGQSSFKPVRRQSTPEQRRRQETPEEEFPVFEEDRMSVGPLPPPPDGM